MIRPHLLLHRARSRPEGAARRPRARRTLAATVAAAAALAVILSAPLAARATLVLHYDLEDLVGEAESIVHGRIIGQHSDWEGQAIVTRVTVEVYECLKGTHQPGDHLVVYQHGGVVGDLAMRVIGAPELITGQEVVLFLEARPNQVEPLVLGLSQGLFNVVPNPSGESVVTRSLEGLELVEIDGFGRLRPVARLPLQELIGAPPEILGPAPPELGDAITLDRFLDVVHHAVLGSQGETP
jgi:hypothetical protein